MLFKSATSRNIFSTVGLGVVTTIGVAATLVGLSYGTIRGAGIDKMQTAASDAAAEVNRTLSVAHEMVAGLDYSVSALREKGIADRDVVMAVLTKTLEGFPGAIGLSTGWEPNAFDGKDADFVGKPAHDQTGRFVPYIYRAGGTIKTDVLVDYDKPGTGDYYQLPVKTGKSGSSRALCLSRGWQRRPDDHHLHPGDGKRQGPRLCRRRYRPRQRQPPISPPNDRWAMAVSRSCPLPTPSSAILTRRPWARR